MARITVKHRLGQSFDIDIRGYTLRSDEPSTFGGEDEGPTPTELMVAGLAACAADEAERRLADAGLPYAELEVGANFDWDENAARIATIRLKVTMPADLNEAATLLVRTAMLSCPALKLLTQPPEVECEFGGGLVLALNGREVAARAWPEEPPPDVDSEG
jgi:putative redox protein